MNLANYSTQIYELVKVQKDSFILQSSLKSAFRLECRLSLKRESSIVFSVIYKSLSKENKITFFCNYNTSSQNIVSQLTQVNNKGQHQTCQLYEATCTAQRISSSDGAIFLAQLTHSPVLRLQFMLFKYFYRFSATHKPNPNYYQVLELNPTCTQKQIKANYLKLAKVFHPDVYKGSDMNRFKQIQEAYGVLKSPEKRQEYDRQIRSGTSSESERGEERKQQQDEEDKQSEAGGLKFKFKHSEYREARQDGAVQEEFRKFMQEPIKLDPEKFKIYENVMERQMDKEHKKQLEESFQFTKGVVYKMVHAHKIGYTEQVKQYVEGVNEQLKAEPKKTLKRQALEFLDRYGTGLMVVGALLTVPLLYSGLTRRREIEKDMQDDLAYMQKAAEHIEYTEIQSRFVY